MVWNGNLNVFFLLSAYYFISHDVLKNTQVVIHKIIYVCLFIVHSVYWIARWPHADQMWRCPNHMENIEGLHWTVDWCNWISRDARTLSL